MCREGQRPIAVVAEGLVCHHRPEVRAADADVHDILDPTPGVAEPRPAPHTLREAGHLVQLGLFSVVLLGILKQLERGHNGGAFRARRARGARRCGWRCGC